MKFILALMMLVPSSSIALANPHIAKVTKVAKTNCGNAGGVFSCPTGVKYLGELVQIFWNDELETNPVECSGAKPGLVSFTFGYDYDAGTVAVRDDEKAQARLPACVKAFVQKVTERYLTWWKLLQPIDRSIDVNTSHNVTLSIKK